MLFGLLISRLSLAASAQVTNYDLISITPKTCQQVTLNYIDQIDGQSYPAEIKLLRPIKWLEENDIDQVEKRSIFSLPEFGIDQVEVTVTDITDTKVVTKGTDWHKEKAKTVIGTFKRYAQDVRTYTFIDENGNVEKINATPNHPFYVINKQTYIAIDDITTNDNLISQSGNIVKLICEKDQMVSCGEHINKDGRPVVVYNLEVYMKHVYYVSKSDVLVHNPCLSASGRSFDVDAHNGLFGGQGLNVLRSSTVPEQMYKEPYYDMFHGSGVENETFGPITADDPNAYGEINYKMVMLRAGRVISQHPSIDCIVLISCYAAKIALPQTLADGFHIPVYASTEAVYAARDPLYPDLLALGDKTVGWRKFMPGATSSQPIGQQPSLITRIRDALPN